MTGVVFSACAEVRRGVRRGGFLDRGHVSSVRRGACAETCAEAVSSTGVMFSACAEVRSDVRRGSFLDRGRVFSVRRGAQRRAQRRAQRQFPRQGSCFQRAQRCAATCAEAVSSTEVVFSLQSDPNR